MYASVKVEVKPPDVEMSGSAIGLCNELYVLGMRNGCEICLERREHERKVGRREGAVEVERERQLRIRGEVAHAEPAVETCHGGVGRRETYIVERQGH